VESAAEDQSVMTPAEIQKEQLEILQGHVSKLKDETAGWLDRQARVWQTAIAGIAAVVVFTDQRQIDLFLPLAPILGLAVAAQWLQLNNMVFRAGHAMAIDEVRMNDLVGRVILTHELDLWDSRSKWLKWMHRRRAVVIILGGAAAAMYMVGVWATLGGVDSGSVTVIYALAAGVVLLLALGNLRTFYRLERLGHPSVRARRAA
jgi:hypothetical protein